jgi:hypothetical protein
MIGVGSFVMVTIEALVVNSTNAGTVTLRWAQNANEANNTTIRANSYLIGQRWA